MVIIVVGDVAGRRCYCGVSVVRYSEYLGLREILFFFCFFVINDGMCICMYHLYIVCVWVIVFHSKS